MFYNSAESLMNMFRARYREQFPPGTKRKGGGGGGGGDFYDGYGGGAQHVGLGGQGHGKRQRVPKAQFDPGDGGTPMPLPS